MQKKEPSVSPLFPSARDPATGECGLLAAFIVLTLVALLSPALHEPTRMAFADDRAWGPLPNAMDVLSNAPFALLGLWGLVRLQRIDMALHQAHAACWQALPEPPANTLDCAWLFCAGLLATAAGSVFFHLQPDALGLAVDRAGMVVAFAGIVGLAVCERVSQRAGWPAAWCALAGGLVAVAVSQATGNVLPWALVQFGGMALVLVLSLAPPVAGALGVRLGWVIGCYALAKLFEQADATLYEATGHLVSGHSVKHLTAALAALPVLLALGGLRLRELRHNRAAAEQAPHWILQ